LWALHQNDIPAIPSYTPGFENSADPRVKTYPFQLAMDAALCTPHFVQGTFWYTQNQIMAEDVAG
jgi:hypothetical protein